MWENVKEKMIYVLRWPGTADTIFPSGKCNSFNDNDNKLSNFSPIFHRIRILQANEVNETDPININCVDPLGRSALLMAIDNENLEMVELLIHYNVDTKDALLHAISEEFVEAVEMLLDHEDGNRNKEGHHVSCAQQIWLQEKRRVSFQICRVQMIIIVSPKCVFELLPPNCYANSVFNLELALVLV